MGQEPVVGVAQPPWALGGLQGGCLVRRAAEGDSQRKAEGASREGRSPALRNVGAPRALLPSPTFPLPKQMPREACRAPPPRVPCAATGTAESIKNQTAKITARKTQLGAIGGGGVAV